MGQFLGILSLDHKRSFMQSRYTRMRQWDLPAGTISAPLILDRGRNQADIQIRAAGGPEWWKSRSGLYYQVQQILRDQTGMAGLRGGMNYGTGFLVGGETIDNMGGGSTLVSIAIDTAYVNASTGKGVGTRYLCTRSHTLNDLYFYIASYTGTAANVTAINWEVRSGTETLPTAGAPGLLASGTVNPASATGWIHVSGLTQAMTGGNFYYLLITNAAGNGTDYATIGQRGAQSWTGGNANHALFNSAVSTTNGWTSMTRNSAAGKVIGVFSDGVAIGNSLFDTSLPASNTNQKGLYIDAVTEEMKFLGFAYDVNATVDLYVWEGNIGPSGSPTATGTLITTLGGSNWRATFLSAAYTLLKSTIYRITAHGSGAHTVPRRGLLGTGGTTNLMKCFWGQGAWHWAESSGTSDWSLDVTTEFPLLNLYFEDSVAITSGVQVPGYGHFGGIQSGGHM